VGADASPGFGADGAAEFVHAADDGEAAAGCKAGQDGGIGILACDSGAIEVGLQILIDRGNGVSRFGPDCGELRGIGGRQLGDGRLGGRGREQGEESVRLVVVEEPGGVRAGQQRTGEETENAQVFAHNPTFRIRSYPQTTVKERGPKQRWPQIGVRGIKQTESSETQACG
jgi:hypothetical protein